MADYGICGKCEREYDTESGYMNHTCPVTGYKPTDPTHHGEQFVRQSINALKRGGSSEDSEEIKGLQQLLDSGAPHEVGNKIRQNRVSRGKS